MPTARPTSLYGQLQLHPYGGVRPPRYLPSVYYRNASSEPHVDTSSPPGTTASENATQSLPPFYFEAGYALFAKRPSRPFPPPFLSYPSGSFSDPLSTHHRSRDRRSFYQGQMIRGTTNGDDAVLVSEHFIGANDGVGAWATREKGHAALWSRLILHFWALEAERDRYGGTHDPDPIAYLQRAFEQTKQATSQPNEWFGTTTASSALITSDRETPPHPILYVTQLGDSQVMVIRPRSREIIYKTREQWHWFDCPRQLGTNSPDTPHDNAVMDKVKVEEDDVVLAMTDGVIDNLWEHEVVDNVLGSMKRWQEGESHDEKGVEPAERSYSDGMSFVAQELVKRARTIAEDPFAESPYMEKAVDEGLSIEGGKLDDISVVVAQCKRRKV
ncbi:protein serine/threonine phosphatase 2C [Eremomyces bilateralis CBS 781.70]|uniref:Protein phosphatase n=1 Tax=Eremomyces bilateralis CBS 781.70 TaxID=1392243 RepID=A0A6G1G2S7_9PEZI|nr:protein serine/threonine phosphatase 2C [Eremomyces bilateralis CBS 781.70]KAF1812417.1 protein serine/threonine phosphatase 2C [Eremomyces bilateralis CBS 781.70]